MNAPRGCPPWDDVPTTGSPRFHPNPAGSVALAVALVGASFAAFAAMGAVVMAHLLRRFGGHP